MHDVVTIETAGLGDRSYLVHDGEHAAVIDPQRDIDRVLAVAEAAAVRITHVLETHIHNDYVTGGLALARSDGRGLRRGGGRGCELRPGARRRRGPVLLRPPHADRHGHAGPHARPPVLRPARGPRRPGRRVHRRVPALRRRRTHRPDQPGSDRRADPRPVPLGPAPRGRSARPGGRVPHARVRQLLLRHADQRRLLHDRRRTGGRTSR